MLSLSGLYLHLNGGHYATLDAMLAHPGLQNQYQDKYHTHDPALTAQMAVIVTWHHFN